MTTRMDIAGRMATVVVAGDLAVAHYDDGGREYFFADAAGPDEKAYDPDQPRAPKGSPDGGQWTEAPDAYDFDGLGADSPEWTAMMRHDAWLDRVHESEDRREEAWREALEYYTGDGHQGINALLHADPDALDEDVEDEDEDEDDEDRPAGKSDTAYARDLDDAVNEAPRLAAPVTVFRGFSGDPAAFVVGETVTLNGFQSTSFVPGVAAGFAPGGVLLRIRAKRGLILGHAHSRGGEYEMILAHQEAFRVLKRSSVALGPTTFPVIWLEQK